MLVSLEGCWIFSFFGNLLNVVWDLEPGVFVETWGGGGGGGGG